MHEHEGASAHDADVLEYEGGGLAEATNRWGAFVVGLAGTILVTGIAPVVVTPLGAASIPPIVVITFMRYLLCLRLAELSAMMPDRTGGAPSYVYPAFRLRWQRAAKHANRLASWMYWLGWFPVAPLQHDPWRPSTSPTASASTRATATRRARRGICRRPSSARP